MVSLRVRMVLLAGLAGVLLASPFSRAATPVPPASAGDGLSVMSFNMQHKDRPAHLKIMSDDLRGGLKRVPDFILCQEVVFQRGGQQDNTAQVLGDGLGYYARGTKRHGDHEGIAIVSRYPFDFYAERHLKAQTSKLLLGFNRVSVMGEFMVPGVGRVRVVNTHLTNWGFEHHVRRQQIEETLQWVAERQAQAPAALTFFGGDFNAKRHWDEMKLIDQASSFGDLAFKDYNSSLPTHGSPGDPDKRIDFIFVSGQTGVKLAQETLLWQDGLRDGSSRFYPSDHLGVVHEYALDRPAAMGQASIHEGN